MSKLERKQISLSLGLEDGEDDKNDHPRRFLRLPSGHLLAYGGDNGNVSCLLPEQKPHNGSLDDSDGSEEHQFVIVQRYEDAIRCIAVSEDGRRLAVGFDTGKTLIYCFDDFVCQKDNSSTFGAELSTHPYVEALEKSQNKEEGFLLSQEFNTDDNDAVNFAGPDLGAPARDMVFMPKETGCNATSPSANSYILAIASEAGMFAIDVTNKETMDACDHWLEEEAKESHDQCGIRGLSAGIVQTYSKTGNESSNSTNEILVLASLAMDGRLCLWDFTNKRLLQREDSLCVPKKDVGEIHDADAYDRSCRPIVLHPYQNVGQRSDLIVGTPGKLMPYFRVSKWSGEEGKLKLSNDSTFKIVDGMEKGHIQPIITMMFYTDQLLVTSGQDGQIFVWKRSRSNTNSKGKSGSLVIDTFFGLKWEAVEKYQVASPATDLCVQEFQSEDKISLFSACANGSLQVFNISNHRCVNNVHQKILSNTKQSMINDTSDLDDEKSSSGSISVLNKCDTLDSQENNMTLSKKSAIRKKSRFSDDSKDDDSIDSAVPRQKNVRFLEGNIGNESKQIVEDESQAPTTTASSGEPVCFNNYSDEDSISLVSDGLAQNQAKLVNAVKPQSAFSPSSTPLDLTRRFLCWNHIGSVTLLQGDNNRNIIDINFADSAFRRPISFTDNVNFIVGSVGESGGIFASDTNDDDEFMDDDIDGLDDFNMSERTKQAVMRDQKKRANGSENLKPTGSSIFFYRFQNSSLVSRKNKDWHLILPDGERVLGAACGDGWAAAMTSRQFLRLFSPGGNQNQIVCLKGEPVTMVGRGAFLAVFYHESSPLADKTQQLGYTLWDAADFRVISRGSVSCLSRGSSLSWVGFSNDLSLMVMDTDGMLSMLITTGQDTSDGNDVWEWAPILDTIGLRKSNDDRHWPITVHNGKLICIPLKGGNTYPDADRRPVTTALGLKMPLAKSVVSKNSALEELSVRSNIALSQKKFVRDLYCDSEELEAEYVALCAQVDKVTLRLYSGMVDEGKLESAFDLVSRLHSEKSFDIAIRLADRQYKLADEVEKLKRYKFPSDVDDNNEDNAEDDFASSITSVYYSDGTESKQISPESRRSEKRIIEVNESADTEKKRHRFK